MSKRYLVTGGCGFIGSHLSESLVADGSSVVVLDNLSTGRRDHLTEAAELVVGDVRDHALLERLARDCDGIFHLAAVASVPRCTQEWHISHGINLSASIDIFEIAAECDIPVVYASSSAIYGEAERTPIGEDDPKQPISAYGADKYAMELHALAGARTRDLRSFGLRFFNIYGPRQDPHSPYSGVIAVFIQHALNGTPILIHGDGEQVRDFVYVADAVRVCRAAMERLQDQTSATAEVSNVCTGQPTSIRTLTTSIADLVCRNLPVSNGPERAGDIKTSIGDPSRLSRLLGVSPSTSLPDGLRSILGGR
ncbi:NAD-dependent epimerase/dehydratase family protein [Microvirga alba]|uniref:NAD-dependent epimerase/dehydratase family protein n=1 Tax=Microvirga alba TaxID=2791025 RepID=A0A931FP62_9HYPH|nr:NAD-dependent epimerase/dehydratase family protein [Microvirga alba]MBF9234410.1 NAD-dependent epimerase/dehydratase family protein [Microvirga alba]